MNNYIPSNSTISLFTEWAQCSIARLFGKKVTWEGRELTHITFSLLAQETRTEKESSLLQSHLPKAIEQFENISFWLPFLKNRKESKHTFALIKLLKAIDSIEKIKRSHLDQTVKTLHTYEGPFLSLNKKERSIAFISSCYRRNSDELLSLGAKLQNSKRWQSAETILHPIGLKATQWIEKTLRSSVWNERQLIFHSKEGRNLLHPPKHFLQRRFPFFAAFHHTSIVVPKEGKPWHAHMELRYFEKCPVAIATFLTSDILELEASRLIKKEALKTLRKKLNQTEAETLETLNRMLEENLRKSHQSMATLGVVNRVNAVRVIGYKLINPLGISSKIDRVALVQKGQSLQCAEYASIAVHNAIKAVNQTLREKGLASEDLLHSPFQGMRHPAALRPDDVHERLKPFSKQITG